jgi:hypothetical protein
MLAAVHRSGAPDKLATAALPGWRGRPLKGDLAGFWSLSVTGNWRPLVRSWAAMLRISIWSTNTEEQPMGRAKPMPPMKNARHPGELVREDVLKPLGLRGDQSRRASWRQPPQPVASPE